MQGFCCVVVPVAEASAVVAQATSKVRLNAAMNLDDIDRIFIRAFV
jgi:hypothetical protein